MKKIKITHDNHVYLDDFDIGAFVTEIDVVDEETVVVRLKGAVEVPEKPKTKAKSRKGRGG